MKHGQQLKLLAYLTWREKMKKLLVLLFLVNVSFCINAREAGEQQGQQRSQQKRPDFEALNQLLELDEDQAQQLKSLMDEHKNKRKQKRGEEQADRQAKREEMKAQHEAHKQELLNILSQEQFEKFESYMKQFRPPHPPKRGEK